MQMTRNTGGSVSQRGCIPNLLLPFTFHSKICSYFHSLERRERVERAHTMAPLHHWFSWAAEDSPVTIINDEDYYTDLVLFPTGQSVLHVPICT